MIINKKLENVRSVWQVKNGNRLLENIPKHLARERETIFLLSFDAQFILTGRPGAFTTSYRNLSDISVISLLYEISFFFFFFVVLYPRLCMRGWVYQEFLVHVKNVFEKEGSMQKQELNRNLTEKKNKEKT